MEAITAVKKLAIKKPGTIKLVNHNKLTFIKKAAIPKVTNDIGRAIICKTGFIKVLITPKTTAVTNAADIEEKDNPGTK
jgi:hypothetical protein